MNKQFREDVRQVLSDQMLVERLPDKHWARGPLITLIRYGVIRIEYYLKMRHMKPSQYSEILKEVEAVYAAKRTKAGRDEGLPHGEREHDLHAGRQARTLRDSIEGVPEPRPRVLVRYWLH